MHTILVCNNLLGDSLYILKPIDLYLEKFPGECKALCVLPQFGGALVRKYFQDRLPIFNLVEEAQAQFPEAQVLALSAGKAMEWCAKHYEATKEQPHISEGFAFMLGVDCKNNIQPPLNWLIPYTPEKKERRVIISPFSASCMRHSTGVPNKTIDDWKWEHIYRFLKRHDFVVQCIATTKEMLVNTSLPFSSYRSVESLEEMQMLIQEAELVVSVDTGVSHMSSAFGVPTIILWSTFSPPPSFIAPVWNPSTAYIMMGDPNKATPAGLLYGLKGMLPRVLGDKF